MGCYNTGCQSYQKWFVGNDIRAILLADSAVSEQVGNHIYPCVAAEKTEGDFIVYLRQKYSKQDTKMGVYSDDCEIAVIGVADDYDNAILLASKIDNALTGYHTVGDNVRIKIELKDSTEMYEDNKYIETLIFGIK